MRFRSRIAGFALLAFLHPAAQDIRIDAVMTAKADHFGRDENMFSWCRGTRCD